jgi:hypothetical protein
VLIALLNKTLHKPIRPVLNKPGISGTAQPTEFKSNNKRKFEIGDIRSDQLNDENNSDFQTTRIISIIDFCPKSDPFPFGYAEFMEFDNRVFRKFFNQNISDSKKIFVIMDLLTGQASAWSREYKKSHKESNLNAFYPALKQQFLFLKVKMINLSRLYSLNMSGSLEKYIKEVGSLSACTITVVKNKCFLLLKGLTLVVKNTIDTFIENIFYYIL